ncbi:MAG: bifunctional DNA-formamidopyrimidine glycosylase/DNA-(apurinic or apyrimidinic site) lyase [Kiloniellales bacterium]|nr:bifunctional DNA-formamidopyrimidine glycosylase/DNA-(apurinic or apyrimidinic site) lyase [Kiloniellales bacterium]
MPELPEVETVVRGLRPKLEDRSILKVERRAPQLRFPFPDAFEKRLQGRRVARIGRRAKYILVHLDDGEVLLCHLGMSGRMVFSEDREPEIAKHDHVVFTFDSGLILRFNDPRRFGIMDLVRENELDRHRLLRALGPEPLGNSFSGPVLAAALRGRRCPLKAALLDQRNVAGLGNIYVCEALYRAGLSPRRKASSVGERRAERLAAAIKDVLERAIAAGGSSLRDYVQADGELGYFQHDWAVYGREGKGCPGCDCNLARTGGVKRIVQSGRSTFFCPARQR